MPARGDFQAGSKKRPFISKGFLFTVEDMEDVPDDILRQFGFIDEDVVNEEEVEVWKKLLGMVTRSVAVQSGLAKFYTGEEEFSQDTLKLYSSESDRLQTEAESRLEDIDMDRFGVSEESDELVAMKRYFEVLKDAYDRHWD